ncbi:MAG: TOPRIM nucleotidyl transferase/hydrolase domain-containing protein, partial [Phycicoccus sp.]
MRPDPSADSAAVRVVVLLEGPSDVAAVRVLAASRGLDPANDGYRLVDMRGVTNVGRHLTEARVSGIRVLGLCDAGEARVVVAALQRTGATIDGPDDLASAGFRVCRRDLEDELLRAATPERALTALGEHGLAERFATFAQQPAWAGHPLADQLRRFAGAGSGRKMLVAEALAGLLDAGSTPHPLAALLDDLTRAV